MLTSPILHTVSRFAGRLVPGFAAIALLLTFPASAARAQATKIFVSATGDDNNVGNSVSPKRNFQAAHDAVAAGGEIVVLDTAGYGALTITKSISITVPPGVNGFITVGGGNNGININATTSDVVTIRGLVIEGGGQNGGEGVNSGTVGILDLEGCVIRNFNRGVLLSANGADQLIVRDGIIRDCNDGVYVSASTASATPSALVTHTLVDNATNGSALYAYAGNGGTSTATLTAEYCNVSHSNRGLYVYATGARAYADNCTFSNCTTGLATTNSGVLQSYGDNRFVRCTTVGDFTNTLTPN